MGITVHKFPYLKQYTQREVVLAVGQLILLFPEEEIKKVLNSSNEAFRKWADEHGNLVYNDDRPILPDKEKTP